MPFVNPFSLVTCPTCGHRFHLSMARWRDYDAAKAECPAMREALDLAGTPSVPPDLESTGQASSWGRLHVANNSRRWKKVCPSCRVDLPQFMAAAGAGERIAIVGGMTTGKSQLIWAWLDQLQKLPNQLGVSVRFMDTYDLRTYAPADSNKLWRERYADALNPRPDEDGNTRPPRLVPKDTDLSIKPPLIVRLVFQHRPLWHYLLNPLADFRPVDLLFYDTAGENFNSLHRIQQFAGYVLSATGLVFLVDPLACPELKTLLTRTPSSLGSEGVPADLMGLIRSAFEDDRKVAQDRQLTIPTAVVLTKSDLLRDQFFRDNPHAPGVHHSDYRNGFPAADIDATSADIQEYLVRSGQSGLLNLVTSNFRTYRFFACSALGREPRAGKTLDGPPEPFRVLDPIFWLLCQQGHVRPAPLLPALIEADQ